MSGGHPVSPPAPEAGQWPRLDCQMLTPGTWSLRPGVLSRRECSKGRCSTGWQPLDASCSWCPTLMPQTTFHKPKHGQHPFLILTNENPAGSFHHMYDVTICPPKNLSLQYTAVFSSKDMFYYLFPFYQWNRCSTKGLGDTNWYWQKR